MLCFRGCHSVIVWFCLGCLSLWEHSKRLFELDCWANAPGCAKFSTPEFSISMRAQNAGDGKEIAIAAHTRPVRIWFVHLARGYINKQEKAERNWRFPFYLLFLLLILCLFSSGSCCCASFCSCCLFFFFFFFFFSSLFLSLSFSLSFSSYFSFSLL